MKIRKQLLQFCSPLSGWPPYSPQITLIWRFFYIPLSSFFSFSILFYFYKLRNKFENQLLWYIVKCYIISVYWWYCFIANAKDCFIELYTEYRILFLDFFQNDSSKKKVEAKMDILWNVTMDYVENLVFFFCFFDFTVNIQIFAA